MANQKYRVYLGACDAYNAEKVASIVTKALELIPLNKPISGKIVIKPNLVMAHPKIATEGYTRSEVMEGVITTLLEKGTDIDKIDVVEKSGLGVTTATQYRHAGYKKLRRLGVKLRAMEERRRLTVVLKKGKMHTHLSIAREMAEGDFLVFVPKLKTNVLSNGYSGALKLNIGTIDSKERIFHHHHHLHDKIVDILEAANPDLIVTDGIRMAFGGNQMTQKGIDIGVIAVSTNAVAHDIVCAKLLNLDPFKIDHIKEAISRGYGPQSLDEIEILGDFPMEKAQHITANLDFGFYPVHQFPCNFTIHSGHPYCIGGCHGVFLDWLHMIKDRRPQRLKGFPHYPVLIGKVEKPIKDKKVILVGDCAMASPDITARKITCIKGCPPSHKKIVLMMLIRHFLLAPLVLPSLIFDGFVLYPLKKIKGWIANLGFPRKNRNTGNNTRYPVCLEAQRRLREK